MFTIKTAAVELGLTEFYVRKCIRENKIDAHQELIANTRVSRWIIEDEALAEFANRPKKSVGKREDGRNKYTIYLLQDELEALVEQHPELLIARANPPKAKSS